MVFGKKKTEIDVGKVAEKVLELENRFNALVTILQRNCPSILSYYERVDAQPQTPEPATTKRGETQEILDLIQGKPIEKAKQVLRL